MTEVGDTWYRYEDRHYAPIANADGDFADGPGSVRVEEVRAVVSRVTPCGVWLEWVGWVKKDATRRRFCPTREEAMESFLARKSRQAGILRRRAADAEMAQTAAGQMLREIRAGENPSLLHRDLGSRLLIARGER